MQGNMERFRVYIHPPVSWAILAGIAALFICQGVPVRSGDATFPKAMDNVTVRQGDNAVLRCIIDHMVKRVAWLNRSQILYTGTDKWSIDNRVLLVTNSNYEFSIQIQNVDVYDEGPYTCSVQTDNNPKMSRVHLIVQVPPRIVEISSNVVVNEGNNVSLTCVATGRPEPTVNWRQVSPKVQGFVSEDEYMEISGITREQSGLYECTASNEVAAAVVRTVKVTVNYPPYISGAKNTGVPLGQRGVLQCEASAVPHANFSWYKEDKRLTGVEKGVRVENRETVSRLTFYNVTEHDFGNYTCVAINKLGNANTSIILYEISPPTSAVMPPEETTAALTPLKGPGAVHDGKNNAPSMTSCTWMILPFLFLMHVKFLF